MRKNILLLLHLLLSSLSTCCWITHQDFSFYLLLDNLSRWLLAKRNQRKQHQRKLHQREPALGLLRLNLVWLILQVLPLSHLHRLNQRRIHSRSGNVFCPTASEKDLVDNRKAIFQITLVDGEKTATFCLETFKGLKMSNVIAMTRFADALFQFKVENLSKSEVLMSTSMW